MTTDPTSHNVRAVSMVRVWPDRLPRGLAADALLAVAVGLFETLGLAFLAAPQGGGTVPDWRAYALLATGSLALVLRRRYPATVLWVTVLATAGYYSLGYPGSAAPYAYAIAFYTAVAAGRRLHGVLAAALMVAGTAASMFGAFDNRFVTGDNVLRLAGWLLAVIVIGEVVRTRRAYQAEAEQRAIEAERTREEVARRRTDEERIRIARELHDVLSHNISLINVQAGVAAHLIDKRPEQAHAALAAIKDASKDALRDVRATLGVLRGSDEEDASAPLAPTPSLDRLDGLVSRLTSAGLPVEVRTDGTRRALPAGVDLTAYRIVQEALTNVTRHAGAARASVLITYGTGALGVQVDDDGRGPQANGDGNTGSGLAGMRERAETLGGALETGPSPAGGFQVRASLPLEEVG